MKTWIAKTWIERRALIQDDFDWKRRLWLQRALRWQTEDFDSKSDVDECKEDFDQEKIWFEEEQNFDSRQDSAEDLDSKGSFD